MLRLKQSNLHGYGIGRGRVWTIACNRTWEFESHYYSSKTYQKFTQTSYFDISFIEDLYANATKVESQQASYNILIYL